MRLKIEKLWDPAKRSKYYQGKHDKKQPPKPEQRGVAPILTKDSPFAMAEAYKTLRTNITFSLPDQGCKRIGLTSALMSEGKSTNALNLAIAFAETNVRVLLIDCDMRRPSIARGLGLPASPGLSNILVNLAELDESIRHTHHEYLDLLPSGDIPPNPTELLSSEKMGQILDTLSEQYDYIFVDLPPVCMVADAMIVSSHLNGMLFIIRQNESDQESVKHAISQLQFANAKVLGFILHGVETAKKARYGRRGYYRYGYGRYGYGYGYSAQRDVKHPGDQKK